jgi:hypothetical protein
LTCFHSIYDNQIILDKVFTANTLPTIPARKE